MLNYSSTIKGDFHVILSLRIIQVKGLKPLSHLCSIIDTCDVIRLVPWRSVTVFPFIFHTFNVPTEASKLKFLLSSLERLNFNYFLAM